MNALIQPGQRPQTTHTTPACCRHCALPCPPGAVFCCPGCEAAFGTIQSLGLGNYYLQRLLDPASRAPRPEPTSRADLSSYVHTRQNGTHELLLTIDGAQCGACVWLIEQVLSRDMAVISARVNLTSGRLTLVWRGVASEAERLCALVERLGYRLVPYRFAESTAQSDAAGRALVRALAVAAFAAGNVMLLSIALWVGLSQGMGPATRTLLQWVSALLALPAIAYAGLPFFRSAASALRHVRTNMDVPISLGVILVSALSVAQTLQNGAHTYFDSAITLLFFLLIGRVLDHRARYQARAMAERLLALRAVDVAVIEADGTLQRRPAETVARGALVLTGAGERIGVDGVIRSGLSSLDTSLVTGETLAQKATVGDLVFAGMVNIEAPITIETTATGSDTLLAEMARLIETAQARQGTFVVLADRVARLYAPVVHLAALLTFLAWLLLAGAPIGSALLIACSVLIVTCPCALALAVPTAQVIASQALFARGILLKSATALERLAQVDLVVFDKTGTLTCPEPVLDCVPDPQALTLAASLAANSRHPLSRALCAAAGPVRPAIGALEHPGQGLSLPTADGEIRLGSAAFCNITPAAPQGPDLYLTRPGLPPTRFSFVETLRPHAAETIASLDAMGISVMLASGDHAGQVQAMAQQAGIAHWHASLRPDAKMALIEKLRTMGHHVLMVGDGLNDAPCLASANVSMSPACAADISQTLADLVFQGAGLDAVATCLAAARRTRRVMRQNITLALLYNLIAVPLAMAGLVTPWLAAAAMSGSSLLVMGNSLRLRGAVR